MMRRKTFAFALAAVAALCVAAGGSARSEKTIQLRLRDGFVVKNTHILCAVEISHTLLPGTKVTGCEFANSKGAVPKTYEVVLGVDGSVAMAKVASGGALKPVFKRTPSVLGASGPRLYAISSGDGVTVKGTAITCATTGKKTAARNTIVVTCFKLNTATAKARPGSYGIGITDGGAFIVHFDAKSKPTPVKVAQHGK
jgi:hypothetical protein